MKNTTGMKTNTDSKKNEIVAEFEKRGIAVLRIVKHNSGYKVSIGWRDYFKYRNTPLVDLAEIAQR